MRRAGSASPEAISAERTRSRASDTALSGRPTMANAGSPGATCTCTSTARASIPSKATVETRWTMLPLLPQSKVAEGGEDGKNIKGTPNFSPTDGHSLRDPYQILIQLWKISTDSVLYRQQLSAFVNLTSLTVVEQPVGCIIMTLEDRNLDGIIEIGSFSPFARLGRSEMEVDFSVKDDGSR